MYSERLSWLAFQRIHLKLSCACGHAVTWAPAHLKALPIRMTTDDLAERAVCSECGERPTITPWIMRPVTMFSREERLVPYVRRMFKDGWVVDAPDDA